MQRLFAIRTIGKSKKKNLYPDNKTPEYFNDKMKAKETRNLLNEKAGSSQFFITLGPDHLRYKG